MSAGTAVQRAVAAVGLVATAVIAALAFTGVAFAHDAGNRPTPGDAWTHWNIDPLIAGPLLALSAAYLTGTRRVRRQRRGKWVLTGWHTAAFAGAVAAVVAALISPLESLSGALVSAHMVQHLLLMLVAAPLFAMSRPEVALPWTLPADGRIELGRLLRTPLVTHTRRLSSRPGPVLILHTVTLLAWHLPGAYGWALRNEWAHLLQHGQFFVPAWLFWRIVLARKCAIQVYPRGIMMLFVVAVAGAGLGALMTLSPHPWYAEYGSAALAWGLSPLEDQQLAGVIMWVPGGVVYGLAAAWLFLRWLGSEDRAQTVSPPPIPVADPNTGGGR